MHSMPKEWTAILINAGASCAHGQASVSCKEHLVASTCKLVSGARKAVCTLPKKQKASCCASILFLSQGEELEPARKRAEEFGVKEIYIDDLREEFVRDYVFPMFR